MSLPLSGITYGLAATGCLIWGWRQDDKKPLLALGSVSFIVSSLNIYIEDSERLKFLNFEGVGLVLLIVFLGAYTFLSVCLMERLGITNFRKAFVSSFLPVIYILTLTFATLLPALKAQENPPLGLYVFVTFICVLHVPLFAKGRDHATKTQGPISSVPLTSIRRCLEPSKIPLTFLLAPLFANLLIQFAVGNDWRLWGLNAVFTAAITFLFALAGGASLRFREVLGGPSSRPPGTGKVGTGFC